MEHFKLNILEKARFMFFFFSLPQMGSKNIEETCYLLIMALLSQRVERDGCRRLPDIAGLFLFLMHLRAETRTVEPAEGNGRGKLEGDFGKRG